MFKNLFAKKYDIISIGDTVTDAFIRLKEAHLTCRLDHTACEICMKYGDKIPYDFVEVCTAVGNSANAAVSAARLGANAGLITYLGDDQNGREALEVFKKEGVGTDYVSLEKGHKTNYHYVLWYEADRTILIKHEPYDYKLPAFKEPKWIYLSSLPEHTLPYHQALAEYLKKHPKVKLAFQPGTFQIRFGANTLADLYAHTEIFFCNKEEAATITGIPTTDIKTLATALAAKGPKIVVLTDGPVGAYAYSDSKLYFIPPYPDPKPPYDRTGAGDAFSSTFTVAIMMGKSVEEALMWAPINSMSVVQQVGAQKGLLSQARLVDYLKRAPREYKVSIE
ncbi:MAG: carbohydrate kinase family protein [Patescibacteria group bacterium]